MLRAAVSAMIFVKRAFSAPSPSVADARTTPPSPRTRAWPLTPPDCIHRALMVEPNGSRWRQCIYELSPRPVRPYAVHDLLGRRPPLEYRHVVAVGRRVGVRLRAHRVSARGRHPEFRDIPADPHLLGLGRHALGPIRSAPD